MNESTRWLFQTLVFAIAVAGSGMVGAQNAPAPAFEVATIKPSPPTMPGAVSRYAGCHGTESELDPFGVPMGRCISRAFPLRLVIAYAYDVPSMQVNQMILGESPVLDEIYDIDAKAEKPEVRSRLKLMLQSLLAERFKLAVHREKKELPAYDLVVAKSGPKVQRAQTDRECVPSATRGPCQGFTGGRGRGLHGQRVSMADLAVNLTNWAGRIVLDKTGLAGVFDIETLPWLPDTPGPIVSVESGIDPANLTTLFGTLQEQLGLRLEPQKALIEVLFIDHLEKPAAPH